LWSPISAASPEGFTRKRIYGTSIIACAPHWLPKAPISMTSSIARMKKVLRLPQAAARHGARSAEEMDIDLSASLLIGDSSRDRKLAEACGIPFALVTDVGS